MQQFKIRRKDIGAYYNWSTYNPKWEVKGGKIFKTKHGVLATYREFLERAAQPGHRDICPNSYPAATDLEIVVYEFAEAGVLPIPV